MSCQLLLLILSNTYPGWESAQPKGLSSPWNFVEDLVLESYKYMVIYIFYIYICMVIYAYEWTIRFYNVIYIYIDIWHWNLKFLLHQHLISEKQTHGLRVNSSSTASPWRSNLTVMWVTWWGGDMVMRWCGDSVSRQLLFCSYVSAVSLLEILALDAFRPIRATILAT